MKSPVTGREMRLIREPRSMVFRKESFEIQFHGWLCDETGEVYTDTRLDGLNLNQLSNLFRMKHRLPFPDQIRKLRQRFGLSASRMSEVLGFGVNVYRNYEAGEVPSESNGRLLQMVSEPSDFLKLARISGVLAPKALEKLSVTIAGLNDAGRKEESALNRFLTGDRSPDFSTGFREPDLEKFFEMVMFFSRKMQPFKTKLNKLLYFADIGFFRETGFSISGMRYRALPMGPVPDRYQSLYDLMVSRNLATIMAVPFGEGGLGERFVASETIGFNESRFQAEELQWLEKIAHDFATTNTPEIIGLSHQQAEWLRCNQNMLIMNYSWQ